MKQSLSGGGGEDLIQSLGRRVRKEIDHFEEINLDFEAKVNTEFELNSCGAVQSLVAGFCGDLNTLPSSIRDEEFPDRVS
jgi:hypothetical protein